MSVLPGLGVWTFLMSRSELAVATLGRCPFQLPCSEWMTTTSGNRVWWFFGGADASEYAMVGRPSWGAACSSTPDVCSSLQVKLCHRSRNCCDAQ